MTVSRKLPWLILGAGLVLGILSLISLFYAVQVMNQLSGSSALPSDSLLPVLGPPDHRIDGTDTLWTHDSLPLTLEMLMRRHSILIVDFFFTRCPSVCPTLTRHMKEIQEILAQEPESLSVALVSITVDPLYDRPGILQAYRQKMKIGNTPPWYFFTGDTHTIYSLIRKGFLSALQWDTDPARVVHTTYFYLVDDSLRLRGIYRGMDPKSVTQIIKDVRRLWKENSPA